MSAMRGGRWPGKNMRTRHRPASSRCLREAMQMKQSTPPKMSRWPQAGPRERLSGDRQLFFQLLLLVEARIVTVAGQKLIVSANLYDPAAVEHRDPVRIAHG